MSRVDSPVLEEVADVRPTDWRKRTRPNGTPVITLPNESKPQIVKYDAQSKKRNTHRKSRKVSNKWVLWYNAGHAKDGNTSHGQSEQVFLADVKRASTFRTSDELKEFLTHWREQVDREQGLSRHFSLYMFRNGIKPLWEHPQNIGGGSFYYIMSSNSRQEGVMLWLRLCADALDGKLDTDPPSKQLNGIAISIDKNISSKSSYFIKISVWNENCRAKKYIEHIRELLVTKYFGNCQLAYRRHETRIRRNKETTSPFVDPPKKSDESSSSASASDEDEKCDSVDDDAVNSPDRLSAEEEERQRAKAIALALAQEKARAEAEAEALALAQAQEVVASLPTPSTPVSSRREQEEEMEVEPLPEKRQTVSDPDSAIVVHRRVVMVQEEGEGEGAPEKVVIKTDCSDGVEPSLVRPRTLASRSAAPFLLPNYPSPSSLARLQANLATSFILVILAALMMMIALH